MWKHFALTECAAHCVDKDAKLAERLICVESWYEVNAIMPPLVVRPTVLAGFSQIDFEHFHWKEVKGPLSLREQAEHAVLNALQLGKPPNEDMITPEHDWYGKADLDALFHQFDLCQKYSMIIFNLRSCYRVAFLETRKSQDTRWLYCAVQTIKAVATFTSFIRTRATYASLLKLDVMQHFRFDRFLPFTVIEYSEFVEKRTAMRELLVALDKERRDQEDYDDETRMRDDNDDEAVDDLMDAITAFECISAVLERLVRWTGNKEDLMQTFEHSTALCWYWGADSMEMMNRFDVEVPLLKVYYERFVYYLTEFIRKCLNAMCTYYKRLIVSSKHIAGNVTLVSQGDILHELIHHGYVLPQPVAWTTGYGQFGYVLPSQDILNEHVCTRSCTTYPRVVDDRNRLQRSSCGHRMGDHFVRVHVHMPNYSWNRVMCSACENHVPAYALPHLNSVQGSSPKEEYDEKGCITKCEAGSSSSKQEEKFDEKEWIKKCDAFENESSSDEEQSPRKKKNIFTRL